MCAHSCEKLAVERFRRIVYYDRRRIIIENMLYREPGRSEVRFKNFLIYMHGSQFVNPCPVHD